MALKGGLSFAFCLENCLNGDFCDSWDLLIYDASATNA